MKNGLTDEMEQWPAVWRLLGGWSNSLDSVTVSFN